jgi:hypothetical protein
LSIVGFSPGMQIVDLRTGQLTREGALLVQFMVDSVNGSGAVLTNDGDQIVTGKTISGNRNRLTDIETSSFEHPSGDGSYAVTAQEPGTTNNLAMWSNGDLVDGPVAADVLTTESGMMVNGNSTMQGPLVLASYELAEVPLAEDFPGGLIFVTDEAGGPTVAFSDGTDWFRVQDLAVIS